MADQTCQCNLKGPCQCSTHQHNRSRLSLWTFLGVFIFLAGVTALTVWLVYRPHKPHFAVSSVSIYSLNMSTPSFISTNMQFTIITHNPNSRVSIYYDHFSAYVSYHNQAITTEVELQPLFQDPHSTVVMSPIFGGGDVPVSSDTTNGLVVDENYGVVALRLVLLGELRWKAGVFWSRRYGIYVKCEMLVGFKEDCAGQVPLLGNPECRVDV
ncbi:NDR1/HIN1-like protein 1 [Macadamia integrifolia]|uniref:NDR1/HIN1-like protein 1 n=1 Tax=Macadamia integrifolia TaxID=60698 RepID=UPI001C500CAC|nr:NDR1/HIN1-like protein 1 [Macadamia integrifolia]